MPDVNFHASVSDVSSWTAYCLSTIQASRNWIRCDRSQVTHSSNKPEQCLYAYSPLPHIFTLWFSPRKWWAQERLTRTWLFHTQGCSSNTDTHVSRQPTVPCHSPYRAKHHMVQESVFGITDYLEMQPAAPTQALTLSGAYHSVLPLVSRSKDGFLFEPACICIAI